jgi:hypothetical protein
MHMHTLLSCCYQNQEARTRAHYCQLVGNVYALRFVALLSEWETSMQALYCQDVTMLAIHKSLYLSCCSRNMGTSY